MSKFTLSNKIFEMNLDAKELSVYAYLCSLPSVQDTLDNNSTVKVKQSTIAQKCGLRAVQTVSGIISRIKSKGLVEPVRRSVKANSHKGTYIYEVKKAKTENGYFIVDRRVFGSINPRQMMIYLFLCKAYSVTLCDSWNSYNDISRYTGMKRETVIRTVSELVEKKLIVKSRRKSRENKKVYVDNHYQIIIFVQGKIKKKRNAVLLQTKLHFHLLSSNTYSDNINISINKVKCQVKPVKFCLIRGSPEN
ncbi:MAG: helix-turn-helix domain-containing protein [Ruminococcus sp.]|nr:helix-turn-helix domain-containing protein [Ruminococcus sp.]